ncbi:MAG: type II toxin-antitoxin system VapC family toxin [Verrucomicrobia bacterium]|nr:type II toxin-antitoxin system VapC family toxin [Verrucomicrobiota bacterium]
MNCLLDTCTLLWLTTNPRRLSKTVRETISQPDNVIHVSPASAWELGIKVARKKLILPKPVSEWFPLVCERYDLAELPVTGLVAARSTELPPLHNDPFDRLLAATAIHFNLIVLTPDPLIAQYSNTKTLW